MLAEFDLIRRYFMSPQEAQATDGVALGCGDDATLLIPQSGQQLAVSVDTSVVNVHFPHDAPAHAVGHRALAVALSDLAAMGAAPRWCLMALTLDQRAFNDDAAAERWLSRYASGFHALCQQYDTALVGGDVTSGELSIGVTVMGEVPTGLAMTRSGARPGDVVAVTGALGGGAGGLALWQQGERDLGHPLLQRYLLPQPRLGAGIVLRGLASAAMDVSDGLLADLAHLRAASGVGVDLIPDALPLVDGLVETLGHEQALTAALSGGDDYELLVTLPPDRVEEAAAQLAESGLALSVIGYCTQALGVTGVPAEGATGWQHFRGGAR
ncbi:thiamine-phosphate kinase [Halomonas meridiana]|uniref:Thiamine-monophosphate kinase n=1 Tax=Vreelandella aquamarina TaxID=77097 RepID=A0A857GMB7_9GAMM|nr:thiamine-phosphate kinase [Halomonas meridiana]MDP4556175.1 thiamine-phosphate kinase [Halomonas meridiana]QHD50433.1 thiamine-phosphate kinase [Halomonas meridiana]